LGEIATIIPVPEEVDMRIHSSLLILVLLGLIPGTLSATSRGSADHRGPPTNGAGSAATFTTVPEVEPNLSCPATPLLPGLT
jgi:hypothetical protein